MRVKIEGIDKLKKALDKHVKELGQRFSEVSADVADTFLKRNDVFVPLETGALRGSGMWYQEKAGFQTETIVGYGFEPEWTYYREGRTKPQEPWKYAYGEHGQENNYPTKQIPGTIMEFMEIGFEGYRQEAFDTITMELSKV